MATNIRFYDETGSEVTKDSFALVREVSVSIKQASLLLSEKAYAPSGLEFASEDDLEALANDMAVRIGREVDWIMSNGASQKAPAQKPPTPPRPEPSPSQPNAKAKPSRAKGKKVELDLNKRLDQAPKKAKDREPGQWWVSKCTTYEWTSDELKFFRPNMDFVEGNVLKRLMGDSVHPVWPSDEWFEEMQMTNDGTRRRFRQPVNVMFAVSEKQIAKGQHKGNYYVDVIEVKLAKE